MLLKSLYQLHKLRRDQWLTAGQLREIQQRKLKAIIRHAYEKVTYYRRLFDSAGVRPEDINTGEDLSRIPITTRKQLQQVPVEEMVARDVDLNRCKEITTAGSSGIPLVVFLSQQDSDFYDLVWARACLENGQRLRDKIAAFKFHLPPHRRWFDQVGIWRKHVISLLEEPRKQVEALRSLKPDGIRGNTFQLVNIAKIIKEKGRGEICPRLVFGMGSLLDPHSRELINSAFQTKMFDYYGATEVGCIAWECTEHGGYHINSDTVVLEFVKGGRSAQPGERAKIICTGLHSHTMPFIRYEIGDIGVFSDEKCPCGRGLPLLKYIEGRADDFLCTSDGRPCSPSVIVNQMKLISGIAQFRITQESEQKVLVQLVKGEDFTAETVNRTEDLLKQMLGDGVDVKVEINDGLASDPGGKIRSIICKVPPEF